MFSRELRTWQLHGMILRVNMPGSGFNCLYPYKMSQSPVVWEQPKSKESGKCHEHWLLVRTENVCHRGSFMTQNNKTKQTHKNKQKHLYLKMQWKFTIQYIDCKVHLRCKKVTKRKKMNSGLEKKTKKLTNKQKTYSRTLKSKKPMKETHIYAVTNEHEIQGILMTSEWQRKTIFKSAASWTKTWENYIENRNRNLTRF